MSDAAATAGPTRPPGGSSSTQGAGRAPSRPCNHPSTTPTDRHAGGNRSSSGGVLALLTAIAFVTITYEMLPVGLLPQISAALGTTAQGAGLLVGAYSIAVTLASLPLSALTARFDVKATLLVLLAVMALSALVLSAAPTLAVALPARLVGGLAHAVMWTAIFRLGVAAVPAHRQGRAAATISAGNALAFTLGIPLATVAGDAAGWRVPFTALGAVFVGLAVLVAWRVPRGLGGADAAMTTAAVLRAATRAPLLKVGVTVAALTTAHFLTYTYLAPVLAVAGVQGVSLSWVLTGYGLAGLVGLLVVTVVADARPRAALVVTLALMVASLAALAVALPAPLGSSSAVVAWGVGAGAFNVLLQVLAVRAAGPVTAAAPAVVNATFNVGITCGAAVGGIVLSSAGAVVLPVASAVMLTMVIALALVPRWLPTTDGKQPAAP